jgi:hypothetical protein
MKKKSLLIIALFTISLIFLAGCGNPEDHENHIPTGPEDITFGIADWVLVVSPVLDGKVPSASIVMLYCLDVLHYPTSSDELIVKIADDEIVMSNFFMIPGVYVGSAMLNQGSTYNVEFFINGLSKLNTSLKIAYIPHATFPLNYSYNQPATLNWTVAGNSQYQFAGASSEKEETDQSSEHVKQLDVSSRTYTIPANSVQDFGPGTEFRLGVDQVNYKLMNRIALMSIGSDTQSYYSSKTADNVKQIADKALMVFKRVVKR